MRAQLEWEKCLMQVKKVEGMWYFSTHGENVSQTMSVWIVRLTCVDSEILRQSDAFRVLSKEMFSAVNFSLYSTDGFGLQFVKQEVRLQSSP